MRVYRGALDVTRRIGGSIAAARFANIAAPLLQAPDQGRGLTLTYLAANGCRANEGDLLAEFDAQAVIDHLDDVEAQIAQAEFDIRSRRAQHDAQMQSARQRVKAAKAALDKASLDLRAAPVKTEIARELLRLTFEEAQLTYRETERQFALTIERQETERTLLQLDFDRQIRHRDRHKADLSHCKIKSPMSGMVVVQSFNRGGEQRQFRAGDELSPGQSFLRVVDPGSLLLDGVMNQAESAAIQIGQPAVLRFDAFPDLVLKGHVNALGTVATSGRRTNYYVRRIPVRVSIDDRDDRILPDLSASADVFLEETSGSLIVPREAVTDIDGKHILYVKQADSFAPREIEIGAASNTHVAVISGVQEGEEVAVAALRP